MRKLDTFIIGGGLSGLFSALVLKSKHPEKKIAVATFGSGSLPMSSGTIDFLSRDDRGKFLKSPLAGIQKLPNHHPYKKIGIESIKQAVEFFRDFSAEWSLPYDGSLERQTPVVTSLGTIKSAALTQISMDASPLKYAQKIIVVGINGVKDFFPNVLVENLQKIFPRKQIESVNIDFISNPRRDPLILDIARILDSNEGIQKFADQLKSKVESKTMFITPPIFGTSGASSHGAAESLLESKICETTCLPPSPTGIRLQKILRDSLHKLGIGILENMKIVSSEIKNRRVKSVKTSSGKIFEADRFILATGKFFSGGIEMNQFNSPREPIFNLPIFFEPSENQWSHEDFFMPQGFEKTGILIDENLRPIDASGKLILENVAIIGEILGGFDFTASGSNSGIAIASAFKAGDIDE